MKLALFLSILVVTAGLTGCATNSDYEQGGSGDTFIDDDGYGFENPATSSPSMRPGMRSGDVRDPNALTRPSVGQP